MLADRLPHGSALGRALRWPLRFVPVDLPRHIVFGPAAGSLWYPASGPHGIWLGVYERRVLKAYAREVRENMVVWDIGAHAGLYSLVAARRGATVCAFEPLPANVDWLARTLSANGLAERVAIHPYALAAASGALHFESEPSRMEGRLSSGGSCVVQAFAADDLSLPRPQVIKIDTEGGELDVLAGAARTIGSARPVIFLETHDPVTLRDCLALLPGYRGTELDRTRFICRSSEGPVT